MHQYISKVWGLQLGWREKLVLLYLLSHADKDGVYRSSVDRVASGTGLSRGIVARILRALAEAGFVAWQEEGSGICHLNLAALCETTSGPRRSHLWYNRRG